MADPPPPHPHPLPPTTTPAALTPLITASSIRTLPAPTVRALSSSLVLTNPADAVKELVDNALDAGATSVAVDVAANTLDHLTVRDNGRSVPPGADRALLGRRHCTSKLRNSEELKDVGGRSLGFRGEALASLAEVVRGLWVTVRCEGEGVASVWRVGGDGAREERKAGAPVGTVVRVEGFFERWPVRRQTALRNRERELRRVRNVLQGYALARPGVRLQLRVMDRKGYDWVYAPKPSVGVGGGVERVADVVWKVVGKDAAAQCAYSVRVVNGYTVEAFLPRSDAEGKKIAGHGYFLSIDARPVSTARGTMKLIAKAFREKLKKSNPALEDVKDPFIRMGIGCPPGSYDPNVEPSKDDLLFDDAGAVVTAVKDFLEAFYSSSLPAIEQSSDTTEVSNTGPQVEDDDDDDDEMTADGDIFDQLMDVSSVNLVEAVAAQQNQTQEVTALSSVMSDLNAGRSQVDEEQQTEYDGSPQPKRQRTWKYNMYDIDEDDFAIGDAELDNAPDNEPAENATDQQDLNDITLSNPWTMAKMNSKVRNPEPTNKAQQEQAPSQLIDFRRNLQTKPPSEPRNTQAKSHLLTPQPSSPFRESNSLEGRTIDPRALNMFHSRDIPTVTEASEQANGVHLLSPSNSVQLNSDDGFFPVSTQLSQQGMSNHAVTGGARARLGRGRRHISGLDGVNKAFKSPVNLVRDSSFSNLPSQRPRRPNLFLRRNGIPASISGDAKNTASHVTYGPISDGYDQDIRYWMAGTNRRTRESPTKSDTVVSKGSSSIAHSQPSADPREPRIQVAGLNASGTENQRLHSSPARSLAQGRLTLQESTPAAQPHQRQTKRDSEHLSLGTPVKQPLRGSHRIMHHDRRAHLPLIQGPVPHVPRVDQQDQQSLTSEILIGQPEPQRPTTGLVPLWDLSARQQARGRTASSLPLECIPEGAKMHNIFLMFPDRSTGHQSNNGEAPAIELLREIEKSLQALDRMTNGLSLTRSGDDMQCFFGSEWVEVMSSAVVQKWADRLGELLTQNAPAGFEKAKLREDLSFVIMEAVEKQRSGVSVGV